MSGCSMTCRPSTEEEVACLFPPQPATLAAPTAGGETARKPAHLSHFTDSRFGTSKLAQVAKASEGGAKSRGCVCPAGAPFIDHKHEDLRCCKEGKQFSFKNDLRNQRCRGCLDRRMSQRGKSRSFIQGGCLGRKPGVQEQQCQSARKVNTFASASLCSW